MNVSSRGENWGRMTTMIGVGGGEAGDQKRLPITSDRLVDSGVDVLTFSFYDSCLLCQQLSNSSAPRHTHVRRIACEKSFACVCVSQWVTARASRSCDTERKNRGSRVAGIDSGGLCLCQSQERGRHWGMCVCGPGCDSRSGARVQPESRGEDMDNDGENR